MRVIYHFYILLLIGSPVASAAATDDILIADFEGETYGEWKAEGEAFGPGPARGTLPGQMAVSGYEGERLVNSFFHGDGTTGTLTSPPFRIQRDFVNFLIGGGGHAGKTCINLQVDGEIVRTATGPNEQSGGSEALDWATWDVRDLRGKTGTLQIVDRHTGGWGHINVDQIVHSDKRAQSSVEDRTRELALDGRYLLFPIDNQAPPCRLKIAIDGETVQDFDINLARGQADWWSHLDVSAFEGKKATLTVDKLRPESQGLKRIEASDVLRHTQPLYDEALRPQLRFSQQRGWNNDPNGMVYHDGEYHLFWQSNPFGAKWANMFWGHAVSKDLVHWEELPLALYPRTMAVDKCFSGSAHVDVHNTGGWQRGGEQVLVAAFTDTGCGEAIAISRDRGRHWDYLPENPVIRHAGRDPKLIWYGPGQHWVIAVYDEFEGKQAVAFYTSPDLKEWKLASRIDGFYECPELVELPLDGDPHDKRWVLFAADAQYLVGRFDGKTFTPAQREKRRVHYGEYYASQCFNCLPGGRVVQIGWARIEMPGMPFNQAFSLPTELSLKTGPDGIRLHVEPIEELESLRGDVQSAAEQTITPRQPLRFETDGQLFDILVDVAPQDAKEITLHFGESRVTYDVSAARLDEMPLTLSGGRLTFRVVVDRPMYEVAGGDGDVYKTARRADAGREVAAVELAVRGGTARVRSMKVYRMRSIWKE